MRPTTPDDRDLRRSGWRARPRSRLDTGLSLVLAWALPAALAAQTPRFQRLTIEDGLSQSTVFAIAQDRLGFIWVGTQDGLNRYDGYGFKVYRHDPHRADSLTNNAVRAIHVDEAGVLWLGTDGGLDRLDPATERFQHFRGDSDDPILTLHDAEDGGLWIGTAGGGLSRFDPATGTFESYRHEPADPGSISHDSVRAVRADADGGLWIGTDGGGLNRFDPATGTFTAFRHDPTDPASLAEDTVSCVHQDRAGDIWVCTDDGLDRLEWDPSGHARFRHHRPDPADPASLSNGEVRSLYEDSHGRFWVGTKDGLNRMNRDTGTFESMSHEPGNPTSLSDGFVRALVEDRSGLLWVGTDGRGLNTNDPGRDAFVTYRHLPADPASLSGNMIWSIHEDRQGVLWVGTWGDGVNRLDDPAGRFTRLRNATPGFDPLAANIMQAIHEDSRGTLWVGTDEGLFTLDRESERFAAFGGADRAGLSHKSVRAVYEDGTGALWVGTDLGLNRLDRRTGRFVHWLHQAADPEGLSHDTIWTLYEDASGQLWAGTLDGLNRFDPAADTFRRFRPDPAHPLSNDFVRVLYEDRAGRFWVGTDDGLNLLDRETGRVRIFTEEDGLPNDVIYGILEDDAGGLWLSTNRGLSRFDPDAGTFWNYDERDGLQGNEFNRGAFCRRRNGHLVFGGINGLTVFSPDRIRHNTYVPPVVLTSFKKFNEEVALDTVAAEIRELTLSHEDYVVSFEFAALDYHAPEKNRYAYRLDGLDQGWIDLGTKRDITFTNLDPGSYTFRVRGSNDDGVWNEEGLSVGLLVTPPFWRTGWFQGLSVLTGATLLLGAYQLRTRSMRAHNQALQAEIAERRSAEAAQRSLITALEAKTVEAEAKTEELERKNAELERFAYTISHDLRSPLVTIKGYLGLVEADARGGRLEDLDRDVAFINSATDKMARLLDELLELSRIGRLTNPPVTVPLAELAREAVQLTAGVLRERGVEVVVAPEMPLIQGDRVRLLEVLQNLIENAVKFMGNQPSPRIEIGGRLENGEVVAFVRDNGLGIEPSYQERIFDLFERLDTEVDGTGVGLALVRRILEVHGGRIWVESAGRGRGSTFWFTLPQAGG